MLLEASCRSTKTKDFLFFRVEIERVEDIEQSVFELKVEDETNPETPAEINPGTPVSVGTPMKISATPLTGQASALSDYYYADCTATNGKAAPDDKSLVLIKDGCMVDLGSLGPQIQQQI